MKEDTCVYRFQKPRKTKQLITMEMYIPDIRLFDKPQPPQRQLPDSPSVILTTREIEIFLLMCKQQSNKEIAEKFGLSMNTVKTHKKHICSKLQATRAGSLIAMGIRLGLITSLNFFLE
jgi:DNA-binding CsgD family transcriptional regulator